MSNELQSQENHFYRQHFTEIAQISSEQQLLYLLELARLLQEARGSHRRELKQVLETFTIAVMFYQPSTRTWGSFVSAAKGLGATAVDSQEMTEFSSTTKGEKLTDSAITAATSWGADLIVQRHRDIDSSKQIVEALHQNSLPTLVVNAGSGTAEHPTQAVLDANTIYHHFGRLDGLHVAMVGDMKYGRTVKSLSELLARVGTDNELTFVSPDELKMPDKNLQALNGRVRLNQTDRIEDVTEADVYYWTRVQEEWFKAEGQLELYEQIKDRFVLTTELAQMLNPHSIFMHPLPRKGEISEAVDTDPRAKYLTEQMASGLSTRMALLAAMLLENPYEVLAQLEIWSDLR